MLKNQSLTTNQCSSVTVVKNRNNLVYKTIKN